MVSNFRCQFLTLFRNWCNTQVNKFLVVSILNFSTSKYFSFQSIFQHFKNKSKNFKIFNFLYSIDSHEEFWQHKFVIFDIFWLCVLKNFCAKNFLKQTKSFSLNNSFLCFFCLVSYADIAIHARWVWMKMIITQLRSLEMQTRKRWRLPRHASR